MSDLVTCPKCGLSQSARHAFCARCDFSFDGPAPEDGTPSSTGTPTDQPEGTPTDQPPAPPPPPPPPRSRRRQAVVDQTAESVPDDTVEEALPDAPSWDLPSRPFASNPGRAGGETSRSRAPGLGRDRGSLAQRMGSGSMDAVPTVRASAPEEPPRSEPGRRPHGTSGELRGRPPSSFYPSEQSAPPGDPLMAALVSGDELAMTPLPPPPDILADELEVGHPPVHRTDPGARNPLYPEGLPSDADFSGPKVVPPSTKRRSSVGAVSQKTLPRDPRGRPVASAPTDRGGFLPDTRSTTGRSGAGASVPPAPAAASGARPPIGRSGGADRSAASVWPDSGPGEAGSASARGIPLPPPPVNLGAAPRGSLDLRGLAIRGVLLLVAVLALWTVWDVWQLFGNLGTLNAVVTSGNTATPALVRELDEKVTVLDLEDSVTRRWARLAGETDTYSIGVEVRHRVVVVPIHYTAQREGPFRVDQKLATLDYFIENGWELDGTAETKLRAYRDQRNQKSHTPPPPARPAEPAPEAELPPGDPAESGD